MYPTSSSALVVFLTEYVTVVVRSIVTSYMGGWCFTKSNYMGGWYIYFCKIKKKMNFTCH